MLVGKLIDRINRIVLIDNWCFPALVFCLYIPVVWSGLPGRRKEELALDTVSGFESSISANKTGDRFRDFVRRRERAVYPGAGRRCL